MTVEEIERVLAGVETPTELKAVGSYERSHKNRSTVISASERAAA
ncbi:MAG: hypothetical protein ACR2KV_07885 [Solirubrobacteraceae bacterium]